ncbi:phage minor structural protein, partial [Staphylococcus aureus]
STDAQRKTLTRYGSQIIQNGKEIKLRTTKEEFNASKRTLSRLLADITVNAMKGIYLRYDENGAITSHTIDKDGVKISGDKVDITANREFNVVANNINNKVGKNDIVNSLNLSNEGLDINVNRIGIKGGNANRYVQVQNDFIELGGIVQRTWKGKRSTDDIFTRLKDGHLRFRNNTAGGSLYMSHFGISTYIDGEGEDGGSSGTIQWWDKTYSDSGMNGITINSYGGVVALTSDYNRIIIDSYASANIESREAPIYLSPNTKNKPGLNRFAFTLSNADSAYETDGYIMFGSDENYKYGAGLRFSKRSNKGLVQVVNGDYATGGDTTIESGMGKFNLVKRRDGNSYVSIQSYDLLAVGSDNAGDRVASNSIYKRTYSAPANLHITSAGTIGRATSAKKYKISIENQYINEDDQFSHSKEILKLPIRTWFDKYESEIMAKELESGKKLSDDTFKLSRHTGLIAEEVEELGFNEFVIYDDNGEIEGIAYDRLWVHLIPIIKNQQSKIEKLEELINE